MVSRLLLTGNFAALIRRSVARRSRSVISCSTRRSRNCSNVAPSLAHCSPSFGNSRSIVGKRSCFR